MAINDGTTTDAAQVVDGLVGAIKSITADDNYNALLGICNEVMQLRAKNAELSSTSRNVFEQYWEFRSLLEGEKMQLETEKAALKVELECKKRELADMTMACSRLEAELAETVHKAADAAEARNKLEVELAEAKEVLDRSIQEKAALNDRLGEIETQLQHEKDGHEIATREGTELRSALAERETELSNVRTDLQNTEDRLARAVQNGNNLAEALTLAQTDLATSTARLNRLDGYRAVLTTEPEDNYVNILDSIWTMLFRLVETHFSQQDLDSRVLDDASCWNNLRGAKALKGPTKIPLPQSNSPVAKAMRMAAVLSVVSHNLHRHIFRPVYLLRNDTELTRLLRELEAVQPAKEEHLRATLLAALPATVQQASARARTDQVVREVSWTVQHLLGAIAFDSFCTGLREACLFACAEWHKIQHAQLKIEPYFGPPYDDLEWQALPLPELEGDGSPAVENQTSSSSRSSQTAVEDAADAAPCADAKNSDNVNKLNGVGPALLRPPQYVSESDGADSSSPLGATPVVQGSIVAVEEADEQAASGESAVANTTEHGDESGNDGVDKGTDSKDEGAVSIARNETGEGEARENNKSEGGKSNAVVPTEEEDDENYGNGDANEEEENVNEEEDSDNEEDDDEDDDETGTSMDPSSILLVVWPCMVAVENGDLQPLTQGIVITKSQAAAAVDELRRQARPRQTGSDGGTTKRARSMSIPTLTPRSTA